MTEKEREREDWLEERAAIIEYEGGYARGVAEDLALEMWIAFKLGVKP